MDRYSIAIPARIASSRLPGKMLKQLNGKPVVQHVIERVLQVRNCQQIYVLSDSEEIVRLARALGVCGVMTSEKCCSGTERIVSVLDQITGEWIVNVQGDEPFIDPLLIERLIEQTKAIRNKILTAVYKLKDCAEIGNHNVVKVVLDNQNNAIYFSRSPIPFIRGEKVEDWSKKYVFWGHLGIYVYRRDLLEKYHDLAPSALEKMESLEQLRFLSNGYTISTLEANGRSVAIDTAEDLAKAEQIIAGKI